MASRDYHDGETHAVPPPPYRPPSPAPSYHTIDIQTIPDGESAQPLQPVFPAPRAPGPAQPKSNAPSKSVSMLRWDIENYNRKGFAISLRRWVNVNEELEDGSRLIHIASAKGSVYMVSALLRHGADHTITDTTGYTPIHIATREHHADVVQHLLAAGVHVNSKTLCGFTSLQIAAIRGHRRVVEVLLASGADMESADQKTNPAVLGAARTNHPEIVRLLLDAGAQPWNRDTDGRIVLMYAAKRGWVDVVHRLLLIGSGAEINAVDNNGVTAFHCAANGGYLDVVNQLLKAGLGLDARTTNGHTPLFIAACFAHIPVIETLLHEGADIQAKNQWKQTLLHVAAGGESQNIRAIEILVEGGCDVHAIDCDGHTALDTAIISDFLDAALHLVLSDVAIAEHVCTPRRLARYKLWGIDAWPRHSGNPPFPPDSNDVRQ